MKTMALFSAVLGLLPVAYADDKGSSRAALASKLKPPPVFKNVNLVHTIYLEKNYAKESINLVIENIAKEAQEEYYLPFTASQISRLGGFEVKNRQDASVVPFAAELVELDVRSDLQYYRIRLPTPLQPGSQQTLVINYYLVKAYKPLPASISQDDQQYLTYSFSAVLPSAYTTAKQKTEVRFGSTNVPNYTKLPGAGDVKEFPVKQSSKLTYGPFDETPAGTVEPVSVRFEFNKPVIHIADLERDVEVSHWGGNVAFEERYNLFNRGANLSSPFNRVKWAQSQYYKPTTHALQELNFLLRAGSVDPYYTDVIGNVSSSRFHATKHESSLKAKPRYPVFGGWKYPFTIGWNSDSKNYLRKTANGGFVLSVPFLEGPKQTEGVEYGKVQVRVILPEGAQNVKYYTSIPEPLITKTDVELHKTFLDTIGRTTLIIKTQNVIDELRERQLIVAYDYPLSAALRKPMIVFVSMLAVFVGTWALGKMELKFTAR